MESKPDAEGAIERSEANGLLPAQAIAQTAMTAAVFSGPACSASTARVTELAIGRLAPAPSAATMPNHIVGACTNERREAGQRGYRGRREPHCRPVPRGTAGAEHGACAECCDEVARHRGRRMCRCWARAGPSTRIGSSARVTAATMRSSSRIRRSLKAMRKPSRTRERTSGSGSACR